MNRQSIPPSVRRCAIYTRKSSEEGLDQAFNSLHAQREACQAFILSQTGEGWSALSDIYDDGGWSGGSMDRPALRRLIADIKAGGIDIVVVYKVDRLTRSLHDFARIVETFDQNDVSFVSVTQAFNTENSMGRLTLNVLLSFAQFEREVTGERIRDKIAASKAKGMWMGGNIPLGYDPPTDQATRALVVNPREAEIVRLIFDRYLELGSVYQLRDWLERSGLRSKAWVSTRGRPRGGAVFSRGSLFHMLRNRVYLGEITHKDKAYPGAHQAIVDRELFDAAQASLGVAARRRRDRPLKGSATLLKGRIFDADGHRMSPTFARGKRGQSYCYYVSAPLQQGRALDGDDAIRRVPSEALDTLVRRSVCAVLQGQIEDVTDARIRAVVAQVEVHATSVQLVLDRDAIFARRSDAREALATLSRRLELGQRIGLETGQEHRFRLTIPTRMKLRGGRTWIVTPEGRDAVMPVRISRPLVEGLRTAHEILRRMANSSTADPGKAVLERAPDAPYERKLLRLAYLAPDIQRDILRGRQPAGLTLERLMFGEIPASWDEQRRLFKA